MIRAPQHKYQIHEVPAPEETCTYATTGQIVYRSHGAQDIRNAVEGFSTDLTQELSYTALNMLSVVSEIGRASDTSIVETKAADLILSQSLCQSQDLALAQAQAAIIDQAQAYATERAKDLAQAQSQDQELEKAHQALAASEAQAQQLAQAQQAQQAQQALAASEAQAQQLAQAQQAQQAQQALAASQAQAQQLAQAQQALAMSHAQTGEKGLEWRRYDQGYFNDVPSWFQGLTPSATGVTNGWSDIAQSTGITTSRYLPIAQTNRFSFLVSGYFLPQASGIHTFNLSSDDASYMWFGPPALVEGASASMGDGIINISGLHGNNNSMFSAMLVVGRAYPILIMYGQNEGGWNLQLSFITPGGVETTDGTGLFYKVLPAGVTVDPSIIYTGLGWYRYDQGYFNDDPTWFSSLTPSCAGTTAGWTDIARSNGRASVAQLPIDRTARFSFLIIGYFLAAASGVHQFTLSSDDAAYFWIGSLSNYNIGLGGLHGNNASSVSVLLVAGQAYPMLIMYGQNEGGFNLQFSFVSPGKASSTDGSGYYYATLPSGVHVATAIGLGGLTWYRYDHGYFNDNPAWFQGLTATTQGTTNGWTDIARTPGAVPGMLPIGQTERFSFLVSGYFVPQVSGGHLFTLSSDDASYLWVGSSALGPAASVSIQSASINLSGLHGNNAQSVTIPMTAGQAYPLLIMYGQNAGGWNMSFSFTQPGSGISADGTGYFFQTAPDKDQSLVNPPTTGFSGRYIRIAQPTVGYMHFAEVKVFSTNGGVNIALGAACSSSSNYVSPFPASLLTDGNSKTFAHTSGGDAPWFLIDLGSVLPIAVIQIINRTDCCQARANGVIVSVLDGNRSVTYTSKQFADTIGGTVYADDRGSDPRAYSMYQLNPPNTMIFPQS